MSEHQVLFCPFCRESYEGVKQCPEHDLALVPFDKLSPEEHAEEDDEQGDPADRLPPDQRPISALDPRFGRGWVALGALLNSAALGLDFVRGIGKSGGLLTHELAITAPSLWTLLLVTFTLGYVLARRRTPLALRSLRVLVPALALVSPATVGWVLFRLHQGAAVWATGGRTIGLTPGTAVYVILLASVLIFMGGIKLGALPKSVARRT